MNVKEPEVVLPSKVLSEMEETDASRILTQKTKIALIAHFVNMVPIENLHIDKRTKDIIARVDHVYWLYRKNPFLDTHAMFYQMYKAMGRGTGGNSTLFAKRDDKMLEFVIDQVKPDSRRRDELKVRHVADRLMERGLATDNDRAMSKGAELLTRVARLDQPESEQVDMSKAHFLQPVVTTNISEIDSDKEYIDDEQSRRIMEEFGAYIDPKRQMIEERAKVLEASGGPKTEEED